MSLRQQGLGVPEVWPLIQPSPSPPFIMFPFSWPNPLQSDLHLALTYSLQRVISCHQFDLINESILVSVSLRTNCPVFINSTNPQGKYFLSEIRWLMPKLKASWGHGLRPLMTKFWSMLSLRRSETKRSVEHNFEI